MTPAAATTPDGRRFVLLLGLALVLLGTFPYLYGRYSAGEGEQFMGLVGRGPAGTWGYLMMAGQCRDGHTLVENLMTPEPLPRAYFNPEWWVYGRLCRWTGLSLLQMFHATRVAAVFLFLFALHWLLTVCVPDWRVRRSALLLVVFGSGLGWTVWLANRLAGMSLPQPLDTEGVQVFAYLAAKPHFMLAAACSCAAVAAFVRAQASGGARWFAVTGGIVLLHALMRPYPLPEWAVLCAVFALAAVLREPARWRRILALHAIIPFMMLPAAALYAWLSHSGALGVSGWRTAAQFFAMDALWMGLPFVAAFGWLAWRGARDLSARDYTVLVPSVWLVSALAVNQLHPYFAWGHENAFMVFSAAPVVVLGAGPLRNGFPAWLGGPRRTAAVAVIALLCLPSTVIASAGLFTRLHGEDRPFYYQTNDMAEAMEWLGDHAQPSEVALGDRPVNMFLSGLHGVKTVASHDMLTIRAPEKFREVADFFSPSATVESRRAIAARHGVRYVVVDPGVVGSDANRLAGEMDAQILFQRPNAAVLVLSPPQS